MKRRRAYHAWDAFAFGSYFRVWFSYKNKFKNLKNLKSFKNLKTSKLFKNLGFSSPGAETATTVKAYLHRHDRTELH